MGLLPQTIRVPGVEAPAQAGARGASGGTEARPAGLEAVGHLSTVARFGVHAGDVPTGVEVELM